MSSIRERTVLCIVDLPLKLTSRRNLRAYFSKFGKVQDVSVKKSLKSGMVKFCTHFDAQSAKTQGKVYEGESLNIFWSDSTALDPRSGAKQEYSVTEPEQLWQEDDKECFGIEPTPKEQRKQSAKDMIKHHLKPSGVKRRISLTAGEIKRPDEFVVSKKHSVRVHKSSPKTSLSLKKTSVTVGLKPKIVRRSEVASGQYGEKEMKKTTVIKKQAPKPTPVLIESTHLKLKLSMLNERDELMRKEIVPDSNINTATAIKGTCPDMCPERERVLRQYGHNVAVYEMFPGSNEMDENRAVKEYVRSSADQGVPLPQDLRPVPVLSMTMTYLIINIITKIDNADENKAVWYSFCWNRLRSIRKDIILQQLCDLKTVEIVEQCARFHIICYDHMWGADATSGFDDKINCNTIIDCLQTLRHMYVDLAKQGIICPNESEFYSYLILLKLKSGDVMWEYQKYSLKIQLSTQVQFAVEAYMAFRNNMYSRYFSLVQKAPYLTACLMQRYFYDVRSNALKTMVKAYCLPGKTVGLSLSFVAAILKFDSYESALGFCEKEGVDIKNDLNKEIEGMYMSTSSFLIKEKRLSIAYAVVGEGNSLPVYVPHDVNSSFDECGKLKDLNDEDLLNESQVTLVSEDDQSGINKPLSEIQQSSFKFSLSPSKLPGFISKSTFFPDQGVLEPKKHSDDFYSPKNSSQESLDFDLNSSSNYESSNTDVCEMEQDTDQEMLCEDGDTKENIPVGANQSLSSHESNASGSHHISQPFMIFLPDASNKQSLSPEIQQVKSSLFSQNLHSPLSHVSFPDAQKVKSMFATLKSSEEKPTFSFALNSVPESTVNISVCNSNELINTNFSDSQTVSSKFNILSYNTEEDIHQSMCSSSESNEQKFLQEELKQKDYSKEMVVEKSKIQDTLLHEKRLHEKLIREKAEEDERRKLIELKKLEAEKQKKEADERKVLYMRERRKFINARKYARKCAHHWKKKVEKLKKTRADFPLLVQLSVENHLCKWGVRKSLPSTTIFQRARDQRMVSSVLSQLLMFGVTDSCKYVSSELAEHLARSASKTMKKGVIKPIYWKLAISVPWTDNKSSELFVFNQLMRKWCRQSFYKEESSCLGSVEHILSSLEIPVNISVHFFDNFQANNDLQGMDALAFVALNEGETEKMCLQRLRSLVTSQTSSGELSVAVMSVGGSKLERILKMELEELNEQNLISHWSVSAWSNPNSFFQSLKFLTEHVNIVPHICASSLEVLVKQVTEEFFDALSSNQHLCEGLMSAIKNPNNVVQLYNMCLTKLEDLLMSSKLEKHFGLAEEFKMHVPTSEFGGPELMCGRQYDEVYKSQITKKITSLKLPEFSKWPVKSPTSLMKTLKTYCSQVHDSSIFPQIVRMLDLPDDVKLPLYLEQISWLNVVEVWAECSIRHAFPSCDKTKILFVIYNKHDIQRLIKKQWWLKLPVVAQLHR